MWEEDPRYQEGNFRLLVAVAVISTALATVYGLALQEWSFLAYWYSILGALLGGILIYGVVVCSVAYTARFIARLFRRSSRKHDSNA
jgi:peptidoglycan biosynthesis protein MviN/MurJ (putative lipid II flippase)